MSISIVCITAASRDEALMIGRTLVEERLVACANVLDGLHSIYRWEGAVQSADETILLSKTRDTLVDAVIARVRELHSYDVPAVVSWPIALANPDYARWVERETEGG